VAELLVAGVPALSDLGPFEFPARELAPGGGVEPEVATPNLPVGIDLAFLDRG
jgi:hypothetical protein